jgi:hypothetical protein
MSLEVADILGMGYQEGCASLHRLGPEQLRVVSHLLSCHTRQLGGHVYECDSCHDTVVSYNSCRDRHCPSCQSVARAAWVEERLNELLPVGYFHVVFTVPRELNPFFLSNKEVCYDILFRSVSETLLTLGKDPHWHGGTIGCICILHTWGQNLCEHPHIHCVVPGGGIRADGKKWKSFRGNFLFPVAVMAPLFRRLFLERFRTAVETGKIAFHGRLKEFQEPWACRRLLALLRKKNWVVFAKEPFARAELVIKYLARYTHRVAISNSRLVSADDHSVTFRWKDYRDPVKPKIMNLDLNEFIRRFLLHVLPSRFVRIRYYGFLSNHDRHANIARCMRLLKRRYERRQFGRRIPDIMRRAFGHDLQKCRRCSGGQYQLKRTFGSLFRPRMPGYNTHTGGSTVATSFNTG